MNNLHVSIHVCLSLLEREVLPVLGSGMLLDAIGSYVNSV